MNEQPEIFFPVNSSNQEVDTTVPKPEDVEDLPEDKVDNIVGKLVEAARRVVITPEVSLLLDEFKKKMELTSSLREKKRILLEFINNNIEETTEIFGKAATSFRQKEGTEKIEQIELDRTREYFDTVQAALIDSISKEIKRIISSDLSKEQKLVLIKNQLAQVNVPEQKITEIVGEMSSDRDVDLHLLVRKYLISDLPVIAAATLDLDETIKNLSNDEKSADNKFEVYRETEKVFSHLFDSANVPGLIDLIFAVEYGFGSGGNYSRLKEEKNDEAKQTENVLKKIFQSEEGSQLFFYDLVGFQDDEQTVSEDNCEEKIEQLFASFGNQTDIDLGRKKIKELIAQAIKKTSEANDLPSIEINPEKIILTSDVIKIILYNAKKIDKRKVAEKIDLL